MFRIVAVLAILCFASSAIAAPPNFVVIFCDDLGYGDIGPNGAEGYSTPNLDRLAKEGMRFTDFLVPAAVCSASRAGLLTGCYPQRVSIMGALGPKAKVGIHSDERLLSEVLKDRGYATAIYGKWHLGDHFTFLPTRHGFDDYFGLPYSNDMWPFHPTAKFVPLPLIEKEQVINPAVTADDQRQLTTWYTERAVKFIEAHREQPFFLYLPHSMPHVPLHVSDKFAGKTKRGLFGDVISEIDWSVGQILETLDRLKLAENTVVVFTSDNGPWLSYGNHAGSAGPFREGKGTTWEGGHRVPCLMRWPGKIAAGKTCGELATTMDLLPTLARHAAAKLDPARKIDGHDLTPLWNGEPADRSAYPVFYYYWLYGLEGVRAGEWKLVFPHSFNSLAGTPGKDGKPGGYQLAKTSLALYNLKSDIGEKQDVAAEHPEIVARLEKLAEEARDDLGDSYLKRQGKGVRPAGTRPAE